MLEIREDIPDFLIVLEARDKKSSEEGFTNSLDETAM